MIKILKMRSVIFMLGIILITVLNQKTGDLVRQIDLIFNEDKRFSDSITSKRDIDTLYVRIKRNVGFETMEYVHEKTPGMYYRMADSFGKEGRYYVTVTLEKEGRNTLVSWEVKGSQKFANQIKADILKAVK